MATDKQSANKIPEWAGGGNKGSGIKMDPGPFIGIIKNNVDSSRQGRLQVWIPEIGGAENDPTKWYTVRYASPFFGTTAGVPGTGNSDKFGVESQTYGFWAVPPDIGNMVLIVFVMGDPSRGFWIGCIPNTQSQYMVPGIARSIDNEKRIVSSDFGSGRLSGATYLPSSELNYEDPGKDKDPKFYELPKIIHTFQSNIVMEQGLETDPTRGTITSSSQRESPSQVFGFSTPGRSGVDLSTVVSQTNLDSLVKAGTYTYDQLQEFSKFRRGGHTFVMDDGDFKGDSKLIRLRSGAGHQILMHDTENTLYISNSLGSSWVELNGDGSVNIYGGGSVNIRAQKDLNLHADANVNVHAGDTIRMYAGSLIHSQTKVQLITAEDLYNINAGVIGIRSGGNMDIRSVSGSWSCASLMAINAGTGTWETSGETSIYSSTGGWKTSGELKMVGSQIHLNTTGKTPSAPATPAEPEINPKMDFYNQTNSRFDDELKKWYKVPKDFESVSAFTPTHEPWDRASGSLKLADGQVLPPEQQYVKTKK